MSYKTDSVFEKKITKKIYAEIAAGTKNWV